MQQAYSNWQGDIKYVKNDLTQICWTHYAYVNRGLFLLDPFMIDKIAAVETHILWHLKLHEKVGYAFTLKANFERFSKGS